MRFLRISIFAVLSISAAAYGATAGASATPPSRTIKAPTCQDLAEQRARQVHESASITSSVEAKNLELGEAADSLKVAKNEARKTELTRRVEGLRRELSDLETRELASVNRLGALDAEIAKSCKTEGGRK
jgi:hypothetical protein